MKAINGWTIIKALNKHQELLVKFEDDKFYIATGSYDRDRSLIVSDINYIEIDNYEDLQKLLSIIKAVMNKQANKIYLYDKMKSKDIFLYLINYNSAFKLRDTLKIMLYSYIGVNSAMYCDVTISKDSCRNLYKAILIAINKMKGTDKDGNSR